MIITYSPLRISLGGGGTDLPSYYRQYGGFLIAAAIDKFVYITLHEHFTPHISVRYSKMEVVQDIAEIEHPIVRECLRLAGPSRPFLDIASMADVPAGTGLGSSGSFTTALLRALHIYNRRFVAPAELAEQACRIELDILKEPIGKQDQYIAAFGGITAFEFLPDDKVVVTPLELSAGALHTLEDNLCLFYTGVNRSASGILAEQDQRSRESDREMISNLHFVKELGYQSRDALQTGNLRRFAELMHEHWEHKKKRSHAMSNSWINDCYELARANGALGGKLIGAGGGGFLMFYSEDKTRLRNAMSEAGLRELRIRFRFHGTTMLVQS